MRDLIIPIAVYRRSSLPRVEVMFTADLPFLHEQAVCGECGETSILPVLSLEERGKELGRVLYEDTPAIFLMGLLDAIGLPSLQDAINRKEA